MDIFQYHVGKVNLKSNYQGRNHRRFFPSKWIIGLSRRYLIPYQKPEELGYQILGVLHNNQVWYIDPFPTLSIHNDVPGQPK